MTERIKRDLNVANPDAFYARLIGLHGQLNQAESNRLNARIILLLANQVGDDAILHEVLDHAQGGMKAA